MTQGLGWLKKGLWDLKLFLVMIWKLKENSGLFPPSKRQRDHLGPLLSIPKWSRLVARSHSQQKLNNSKGWIHQGSHYPLVLIPQDSNVSYFPGGAKFPAGNNNRRRWKAKAKSHWIFHCLVQNHQYLAWLERETKEDQHTLRYGCIPTLKGRGAGQLWFIEVHTPPCNQSSLWVWSRLEKKQSKGCEFLAEMQAVPTQEI